MLLPFCIIDYILKIGGAYSWDEKVSFEGNVRSETGVCQPQCQPVEGGVPRCLAPFVSVAV